MPQFITEERSPSNQFLPDKLTIFFHFKSGKPQVVLYGSVVPPVSAKLRLEDYYGEQIFVVTSVFIPKQEGAVYVMLNEASPDQERVIKEEFGG